MKTTGILFFFLVGLQCLAQDDATAQKIKQYIAAHPDNEQPSQTAGNVSKGTLAHGKLMPFKGTNFRYFDAKSYLSGRAFTSDKVKQSMLDSYRELEEQVPGRQFYVMECSNEHGGKIFPHRTHQNGLSVDFMMPLLQDKKPYYGLDTIGADHYWLEFDNAGRYSKDQTISIDFNLVAQHILELEKQARKNGLKISKVIIKTELKDELFATAFGQQLQTSGIYVVKSLTPLINGLHDDHYHIDFEKTP